MNSVRILIYIVIKLSLLLEFTLVEGSRIKFVTCGSVLKLLNVDYNVRLHSHDVKYGSGSGQQSVTAIEIVEDVNSHWKIKPGIGEGCTRGEPFKCGSTIRLEHLQTKKNLHSHLFTSPLSGNQEVSCYGTQGVGDTGDNWELICSGEFWLRDSSVKLRHIDTGAYLGVSGRAYGRPINGQLEVVGYSNPKKGATWKSAEGLFIHPSDPSTNNRHDEL